MEVVTSAEISYRARSVHEFEWRVRRKATLEEDAQRQPTRRPMAKILDFDTSAEAAYSRRDGYYLKPLPSLLPPEVTESAA